jgi:hypothetical protein
MAEIPVLLILHLIGVALLDQSGGSRQNGVTLRACGMSEIRDRGNGRIEGPDRRPQLRDDASAGADAFARRSNAANIGNGDSL